MTDVKHDTAKLNNINILMRMEKLERTQTAHDKILNGPNDADQPGGLRALTYENTRFRKILTRWLWLLTIASTSLAVERIFTLITNGG